MGKNNKNKQKKKNQSKNASTVNNEKQKVENIEKKLQKMEEEQNITEHDKESVKEEVNKEVGIRTEITIKSVQELYRKASEIEKILEKRKNEYEHLKEQLDNEKKLLETEKSNTEQLKNKLIKRLNKYDEELKEINQLRVDGGWSSVIDKKLLDEYDEKLKEQEKILKDKINELNEKHTEYISALTDLHNKEIELEIFFQEKIVEEKERLEKDYQDRISKKENKLRELSDELEKKQRELEKKEKELRYDIEDFEDEKKYLKERVEQKVKQKMAELNEKIKTLEEKNEGLKNEVKKLREELHYLGEYNAKDVIAELRQKERKIFNLEEKLATDSDILKIDKLKRLQKENLEWQDKLQEVYAQLNEYKTKYEKQKLQIGEKEKLEFEKEELEQRIKLQQTALEELKEEVNELTRQREDKVTFVSCTEMDKNYKKPSYNFDENKIDNKWILNVQQAIAQVTNVRLYYGENILRSFVAGLAMSRFSILQGISGTGKTSLPKAFAKAIGGNYGIVEVQSGWKDRQDLIGYYNTFEKKFYEGKFLKLLYMAGTPKYKDKPFFIILDEMNLSHPEHYFADMLSIMEETNPKKQILTISNKVKDMPSLMVEKDGGIGLRIPQNVWFIGTANHDETTLQFAPKTYDRANILEMPINIESFDIKEVMLSRISVTNNTLLEFFENNKISSNKLEKINNYITGNFKIICNKLGLSWGNRLKKQIELFIPVFEALGGDIANALDHIIATKILRNIKGRYDLSETTLTEMKNELENNFQKTFQGGAMKSLEIINDELNRIE